MALALRCAGVPTKHLIYDRPLHNDFVLAWRPLRRQQQGQQLQQQAAASRSGEPDGDGLLQPFARDLIAVLTGRARVRYATAAGAAQAAAAVAAIERAAGMPPPQPQPMPRL